ncbi:MULTISPECIES: hypothetical protein [Rhizobium]|uniref:hypothetical protein n=1 Tax=Rhizobium TaxID=379 RepID=UPI002360BCDC|nr:hypothetical protein [Rhizobium sp. MC62]MDC9808804.1 hypothetical protein [Rhizobium sp. MC62]
MSDNVVIPEYRDSKTGEVVRPYLVTVFARTDMIRDGSNNDLWANWSSSPETACSNASTSTIGKSFIVSMRSLGPCQYGHDITMVEKY